MKHGIQKINYTQKFIYLDAEYKELFSVSCTEKELMEAVIPYAIENERIYSVDRRWILDDSWVDFRAIRNPKTGELYDEYKKRA